MKPLPFDYTRCKPQHPDGKCQNCRRWSDHPDQTHNPYRQSYVVVNRSTDKACIYIPDSYLESEHD